MITRFPKALVLSFAALLNVTSINTIWTPTQDWYLEWAKYLSDGLVPYRDFYIPLPPAYVILNQLCLLTGDPLLASRFLNTVVYSLLALGIYLFLAIFSRKSTAIWVTLAVILFWEIHPTDTIGGYYEFATCLAIWGLYFLVKHSSRIENIIGGVMIALASLTKQNFGFVTVVVLAVIILQQRNLKTRNKEVESDSSNRMFFAAGAILTYLIFFIYLLFTNSLGQFLRIMMQGGGKNLTLTNLFKNIFSEAASSSNLFSALLFIFAIYILNRRSEKFSIIGKHKRLASSLLLSTSIFVVHLQQYPTAFPRIIIEILVFTLIIFSTEKIIRVSGFQRVEVVFLVILPVVVVIGTWMISNSKHGFFQSFFREISGDKSLGILFMLWNYVGGIVWVTSIFIFAIYVWNYLHRFKKIKLKNKGRVKLNSKNHESYSETWDKFRKKFESGSLVYFYAAVLALIASGFINSFNGAAYTDSNILIVAIMLALGLDLVPESHELTTRLFWGIGIPLIASAAIITIVPYQWLGWSELKTPNVRNSIPLFRNFELTQTETTFYEKISKAIVMASDEHHESAARIAELPAQPILDSFSTLKQYRLNCPIMHIDVCPESAAIVDLRRIEANPPAVFVYFDFGTPLLKDFENVYRFGKISTIRKIRDNLLSDSRYRLASTISDPADPNSKVYIFSLKGPQRI
jgi:hypothetical protein